MPFRQCPDCGAYLDPGENCDCKKGDCPRQVNSPKQAIDEATSSEVSIAEFPAKVKNILRRLRETHKIPVKVIVDAVRELYPKYDRTLQSKCEHGDEYGIDLRRNALDSLLEQFAPELLEEEKYRRGGCHRLTCRVHCRLDAEDYSALLICIKAEGYSTMQGWLSHKICKYLREKRESEKERETP